MKPELKVCCGIIEEAGKFYAFRRGGGMKMPGKWEFPGGKVEAGEEPIAALHRELKEELNIEIEIIRPLNAVSHNYPDFSIELIPFIVKISAGAITLNEHDAIKLGSIEQLVNLDWAEADIPVLNQLCS